MRIAINGLAVTADMTGIGRTTLSSLRAILKRNTQDEFFLFLPKDAPQDLGLEADNLECFETDVSLKQPLRSLLFEEFQLPRRLRGARIDLYFAPSFLLPAFPGARTEVICVHDLAWRLFPRTKSLLFRSYMNRRLPAALRRAARIVCVSHATASDLERHYPATTRDGVRVIHNGVDLDVFSPDPSPARDVDEVYVAVVGNQDPRKNVETLLDAFPLFHARMRPCRLVMAGPGHPPGKGKRVAFDFVGYLEPAELTALYRKALMVVQPSLYEGFGLPVLEAMACGTAVACADIPVFREVAGDCARYFDPLKAESIAEAMESLAEDDMLREDLAKRGLARAQEFSWDKTAERLLALFDEAVR